MKYKKTEYGYIGKKKTAMLLATLLFAVVIAAIYLTGYFLNDKSNVSLWTVAAIVLVLPAAKFLVSFLVLFPYKSPLESQYRELKNTLKEGSSLLSDMVITSPEKVMNLDFVVVSHHSVLGVLGKDKQELSYIQTYLFKGIHNHADGYKIKLYEDFEGFMKAVKALNDANDNEEEKEKAESYLHSLIV